MYCSQKDEERKLAAKQEGNKDLQITQKMKWNGMNKAPQAAPWGHRTEIMDSNGNGCYKDCPDHKLRN